MSGDGMSTVVQSLTGSDGLTSNNMWTEVGNAVPLIVGVTIFSLGFFIVRKLIKGVGKGKVRL